MNEFQANALLETDPIIAQIISNGYVLNEKNCFFKKFAGSLLIISKRDNEWFFEQVFINNLDKISTWSRTVINFKNDDDRVIPYMERYYYRMMDTNFFIDSSYINKPVPD